jgi:hypothetical protein
MGAQYQICVPATGYTPADPNDWGAVSPTTIAAALDQLANTDRAGVAVNVNAIGPSNSLTFQTPAITPVASGTYLVWASAHIESSVVVQAIGTLYADVATVIPGASKTISMFDGGGVIYTPVPLIGKVSLNKAVPHTFSMEVSCLPGTNLTALANQMTIMWHEIGG